MDATLKTVKGLRRLGRRSEMSLEPRAKSGHASRYDGTSGVGGAAAAMLGLIKVVGEQECGVLFRRGRAWDSGSPSAEAPGRRFGSPSN
jgi:hypothetical protein